MARKTGAQAQLLMVLESTYGTSPGGNFRQMPFISVDLGAEQALIDNDVLGQGRDPLAPFRDIRRVSGNLVVPLDVRNMGYWLRLLLGAPTTAGAGDPFTHTFVSGGTGLPSASIEVGNPEATAVYRLLEGIKANTLNVNLSRSGGAQATFGLLGQDETKAGTTGGGTPPAVNTYQRFNQFHGSIQRNTVNLGSILSANFTFSNGMETVETIRTDALVEGVDEGMASCTGEVTVRFDNSTLLDDAIAETVVQLDLCYVITTVNRELVFRMEEVHLQRPRISVDGPGGIDVTFPFQCEKDEVAGQMMKIILYNDLADFDNPA